MPNTREIEIAQLRRADAQKIGKIDALIEYFTNVRGHAPERIAVEPEWHAAILAKHAGADSLVRHGVPLVPVK
jgi:hypothetical protein